MLHSRVWRALAAVLVVSPTFVGIAGAAEVETSEPQPLPATFRVQLPDTGLQQFALFEIRGEAPKKAFKQIAVSVELNSLYGSAFRYAAGSTKPKTKSGVTSKQLVFAINNINSGDSVASAPGSTCTDVDNQPVPCGPGTVKVTFSSSAKVARSRRGFGVPGGTGQFSALFVEMLVGEVDLEDVQKTISKVVTIDHIADFAGFSSSYEEIIENTEKDAKANGIDSFSAAPPEDQL